MMNKEHDPNEPVAYINLDEKRLEWAVPFEFKSSCFVLGKLPLYLHPPKTAETEAEPVLYIKEQELLYIQVLKQEGLAQEWKSNLGFVKEAGDVGLYLHPPKPAEPARKPMTEKEVEAACPYTDEDFMGGFFEGVRFAEKHHGITDADL
jgi:hypothetical protein